MYGKEGNARSKFMVMIGLRGIPDLWENKQQRHQIDNRIYSRIPFLVGSTTQVTTTQNNI